MCQEKRCTRMAQIRFVKLDRDPDDKIGAIALCNGHAVAFMRYHCHQMDPESKIPAWPPPSGQTTTSEEGAIV